MKVLFDFDGFKETVGGVSRCTVNLIAHFPNWVETEISIDVCDNIYFLKSNIKPDVNPCKVNLNNFITQRDFWGKVKLFRLAQKLLPSFPTYRNVNKPLSIEALTRQNFDIFHCPSTTADTYFLDYIKEKPFVLTVHDMVSELFFAPNNFQTRVKMKLLPLASHVVTISQKSKEDLMRIMNVPEEKISVIYHGAPSVISTIPPRLIDNPYFLYVGKRAGYKNFNQTLVDFSLFAKDYPEVKLIATGAHFNNEENKMIRDLGLQNVVSNIFASESELASLYKHAVGFIFPSLYEGFGLPILEAFSYDCPVLLNDTSCFPEIAKDAGIYFHSRPDDNISDLPEKLKMLYTMSSGERQSIIKKGKIRGRDFSWDKASSMLAEVYRKVL